MAFLHQHVSSDSVTGPLSVIDASSTFFPQHLGAFPRPIPQLTTRNILINSKKEKNKTKLPRASMISLFGFISKRYTFILDLGGWEPVERIGCGVRKNKVVEGTMQNHNPLGLQDHV